MAAAIDLNSDLGEGYGPWRMGDDEQILRVVTSANIACGGHAGDPATMVETLALARDQGVVAGAHPGFADREGFGRRLLPLSTREVEQLVATQLGALLGAAALANAEVRYVKPHGALGNWAADDRGAADAVVRATMAVDPGLAILAISGTELERAAADAGVWVFSEIFADRGYLATGRLVPRQMPGAMIHDAETAAERLLAFLSSGLMPTVDAKPIKLEAHSICVHGDSAGALAMASHIRQRLEASGVQFSSFLSS
ncbi:5-oxoprolinase subunit PxpA [Bosea vestrisii]|uniref:LamB/YcsF family protein n=1 Tax=Bosea vestrisii TaxID=151416 RepID=UPI0024DF47F1|nr:5-oxoprolinase subunit PxpA [Bosea vestrisii]WID95189.1 5-oxoprolinase subunit PxpA [Bosea vestrisii]